MDGQKFINEIITKAKSEIRVYGTPSILLFKISLAKGTELARKLNAREDLVSLGISLMDIKLGEALKSNKVSEHVQMSLAYAKELLVASQELTDEEKTIVYNAIESHHGSVAHTSLESEIVTNADCYRFIHPLGVFEYIRMLSLRFDSSTEIVTQAETKLNEKWSLITLPIVKEELAPHYKYFTELFARASKDF